MGSVYYQSVVADGEARVALLNIGTEPSKGTDFYKECHALLQSAPVRFVGNVEGHGIFHRPADVVVCDGFTGNIFLKTIEGLAKSMVQWIKSELTRKPLRLIGAFLCRGAFKAVKNRTSTDEYGGTPLLCVNGICIKAHGNSSPRALRNAVRNARNAVQLRINTRIVDAMKPLHEQIPSRESASA